MVVRATVLLGALVTAGAERPHSYGDVGRVVSEGDFSPKVTLGEVLASPHAYGLGSLSGLRGEITILDGQAWLSYPPQSASAPAIRVVTEDTDAEKAAFLVATHVAPDGWTKVDLPQGLSSQDLDSTLARAARANGLEDRELVFQVKGTLETLTLAIVDGRRVPPGPGTEEALAAANVLQPIPPAPQADLIGFYTPAPLHPPRPPHPRPRRGPRESRHRPRRRLHPDPRRHPLAPIPLEEDLCTSPREGEERSPAEGRG